MKDSLFEILLGLFEKTLTQLKEKHQGSLTNDGERANPVDITNTEQKIGVPIQVVKQASLNAMRVLTFDEQMKLTKASYQFLMRMVSLGVIDSQAFEMILNRLVFSDSRFVSLQETKWTIRNTLAQSLAADQLAFLELVLYHTEDGLSLH